MSGSESRWRWLGLDGCRGGWLVCAIDHHGRPEIRREEGLDVLRRPELELALVDMPIGLTEFAASRDCDRLLRRQRGVRAASVFNPPVRAALGAEDHATASALNRVHSGKGLSIQSWNLFPKIRALDAFLRQSELVRERVWESHPEWLFAMLAGAVGYDVPLDAKRTPSGRRQRLRILNHAAGVSAGTLERMLPPTPAKAASDDVLDALVLAFAARSICIGGAHHLPAAPPRDGFSLRMGVAAPLRWMQECEAVPECIE